MSKLHLPISEQAKLPTGVGPANGRYYTRAEMAELDRIRGAQWFLLRNNGPSGERWPCRECRTATTAANAGHIATAAVYHDFLTLRHIPQPFSHWDAQAYAMVRVQARESGSRLAPVQLLNLAINHPRTAREMMTGVTSGEDVYGFMIGVAEPISLADAERYAARIRLAGESGYRLRPSPFARIATV